MSTLAHHWTALATAALLGTDRRSLPPAPLGPLGDLAVDDAAASPSERLLDAVAMLSTMRRAGLLPGPAAEPLPALDADPRPECPAAGVERLHRVLAEWPLLLPEWIALVDHHGWRIPPDAVAMLLHHRRVGAEQREAVIAHAGALVPWLAQVVPNEVVLRRAQSSKPSAKQSAKQSAGQSAGKQDVPLPAELTPFEHESAPEYAQRLAAALARAQVHHAHAPALVRVVSALPLTFLSPLADALSRAATHSQTMGVVATLAELARFRLDLNEELLP